MGQGSSKSTETPAAAAPSQKVGIKSGKKICCCCPDTKKARDECVVFKGEDHPDCQKLIEAHKACLRSEGFDVK
jgi:cytochrome c oxidase assembly protein subunit 17